MLPLLTSEGLHTDKPPGQTLGGVGRDHDLACHGQHVRVAAKASQRGLVPVFLYGQSYKNGGAYIDGIANKQSHKTIPTATATES